MKTKKFSKMLRYVILTSVFIFGGFMNASALKAPCLKPPLGWNSYDAWSYGVTEAQFMQNVHYVADNLKKFGWEYCVLDFIWWVPLKGASWAVEQNASYSPWGNMDQYGRMIPDTVRFPSAKGGRGFKPIADSVHNLGLKFGLHFMRGVPRQAAQNNNYTIKGSTYTTQQAADKSSTCPWLNWMYGTNMSTPAGQAYLNSVVSLADDWTVDFLKVDDLSAATYHSAEVVGYANAIAAAKREIVFSTSPGPTPLANASHVIQYANMWRLVNDLWDTWAQLDNSYKVAEDWRRKLVNGKQISGPGHWLDVDMLPFGHLALYGPVGNPRYSLSTYTKGEHRLMLLLWCINNGPLIWGGHLPDNKNDLFYDSLMMNADAIYINQNGINGKVIRSDTNNVTPNLPIWVSTDPIDTTTKFVLFANLSSSSATFSLNMNSIGISGTVSAKDVWSRKTLGNFTTTFSQNIPKHDAGLFIISNTTSAKLQNSTPSNRSLGEKVFFSTSNNYEIPKAYAGKTVNLSIYNINGVLLNTILTSDPSVLLQKRGLHSAKLFIVKIKEFDK